MTFVGYEIPQVPIAVWGRTVNDRYGWEKVADLEVFGVECDLEVGFAELLETWTVVLLRSAVERGVCYETRGAVVNERVLFIFEKLVKQFKVVGRRAVRIIFCVEK